MLWIINFKISVLCWKRLVVAHERFDFHFSFNSYTFELTQQNTYSIWCFMRFNLIVNYCKKPPVVPPIVIILHMVWLLRYLMGCCCPMQRSSHTVLSKSCDYDSVLVVVFPIRYINIPCLFCFFGAFCLTYLSFFRVIALSIWCVVYLHNALDIHFSVITFCLLRNL